MRIDKKPPVSFRFWMLLIPAFFMISSGKDNRVEVIKELKRVKASFKGLKSYKAVLQYQIFENNTQATKKKAIVYAKGDHFSTDFGVYKIINNRKYNVVINHEDKMVLIANPVKYDFINQLNPEMADTIYETMAELSLDKRSDSYAIIRMRLFEDSDEMTEYHYNPSDLSIKRLISSVSMAGMGDENDIVKTDILFQEFIKNYKIDDNMFSTDGIFVMSKTRLVPATAYKSYQFSYDVNQ